jgi:hypothetical protein
MVLNNYRLYYQINEKNAFVWLNFENYKCNLKPEDYKSWRPCNSAERKHIEVMKKERTMAKSTNNPYGYIGLINRNSNDFCLQRLGEGAEVVDKRKRNVGKRCQNWKKPELVDLVANRLKVNIDEDFGFDRSDVDKMRNNPKFNNLLQNNGTLKDYKRVAFWNAQDVNYLCSKIMQNFADKKLLVDDPNCGTSKKIR